jgi:hypothetical protein
VQIGLNVICTLYGLNIMCIVPGRSVSTGVICREKEKELSSPGLDRRSQQHSHPNTGDTEGKANIPTKGLRG